MHETNLPERFDIDPKQWPRDRGLIGCLVAWALSIVGVVAVAVTISFWPVIIMGSLLLTVVPWSFAYHRQESLIATPCHLIIATGGKTDSALLIKRGNALKLTLEHVQERGETESVRTLNLYYKSHGCWNRRQLGKWICQEGKATLFQRLAEFLSYHGFEVELHRDENTDSQSHEAIEDKDGVRNRP